MTTMIMNRGVGLTSNINYDLPMLPHGWEWASIGNVDSFIGSGITPKGGKKVYVKSGIPFIRSQNVYHEGLQLDDVVYVSPELHQKMSRTHVKPGDVLLNITGASIGRCTYVRPSLPNANVNQHVCIIRTNKRIIPQYLSHWLNSHIAQDIIFNINKGVTRQGLNYSHIRNIPFPIASTTEQERIISKLEELFTKLDAGIEYLKKTRILLNQYRRSVLKHAFEGRFTKQWRDVNTNLVKQLSRLIEAIDRSKEGKNKKNRRLIKSDLLQIPTDWQWVTIGDIAQSMKNGIYRLPNFYNDNGIACLRMYNIEDGNIVWKDIKRMNLTANERAEYELVPGDILVNRVNSRELVGKAAIIPANLETCVYESKNIRVRLFKEFINSRLVTFWFLLCRQEYFNRNAQQTVGMASINQAQLSAMPIPLMSIQEQVLVTEEIENKFSIIDNNKKIVENALSYSKRLRRGILKSAFEGNLVAQDPNDEPAEILLEKIKKERSLNHITQDKSKRKIVDPSKQMRLI